MIFILAVFLVIFFTFVGHIALVSLAETIIFVKTGTNGQGHNVYIYYSFLIFELYGAIALRTRESLYFLPKILTFSMFAHLLYLNLTPYGFYNISILGVIMLNIGTFAFAFQEIEIPKYNIPVAQSYEKPTFHRPRALLQPLFSLSTYHTFPTVWSIFLPFYDQSFFSLDELSLVNQDYARMNTYLEREGENNNGDDDNGNDNDDNDENY